jgi:hypothetical protein
MHIVEFLVAADLFTVLKEDKYVSTSVECAQNYTQTDTGKFIHLLEEKQDEAVRRIRDTIQDLGSERGLPELGVVSNIRGSAAQSRMKLLGSSAPSKQRPMRV